jgi:hypothetical protein
MQDALYTTKIYPIVFAQCSNATRLKRMQKRKLYHMILFWACPMLK